MEGAFFCAEFHDLAVVQNFPIFKKKDFRDSVMVWTSSARVMELSRSEPLEWGAVS